MRKSSIILVVAGALASVALAITVAVLLRSTSSARADSSASAKPKSAIATPAAGAPAIVKFAANPAPTPAFDVKGLSGDEIDSAKFPGKVTLLSFWATWCQPCHIEIPELVELQKKYPDKLQIIGIDMDDADTPADVQHVKDVAAELHINYPVLIATQKLVDEYGGVPALPTVFVLDTNGRVVQKHTGVIGTEDYDNEIRLLANLPVNAKVETFQDTGQIFLTNASKATELPGVDFSGLTPAQKREALKRMNSNSCSCGCGLTIAECRMNDSTCDISKAAAEQVIADVKSGKPDPSTAKTAAK